VKVPQIWQTWLFAAAALLTIVVSLVGQPDLITQLFILAPAVAILGLPHGALDLPIAQALWPLDGWRGKLRFVGLYVCLALLVIAVWIVLPGTALYVFLFYSAFHFSGDWDGAGATLRFSGGVATVGAPALFQTGEVATLFGYLAPEPAAELAALLLAVIAGISLGIFVATISLRPQLRNSAAGEQGIIWIAAACLTPLVYFVVYFCMLHSVRHFSNAFASLDDPHQGLRVATLLSVVTVFAGVIGFIVLQGFKPELLEQSILRIIFIGLAALTVPHMILVDRFQRKLKQQ
jgi:Brp/Blh family beta-carotene 15,15'-monooxygenase